MNENGTIELDSTNVDPVYFYDVNGDGFASPIDVLNVLNILNSYPGSLPEGEGVDRADEALTPAAADILANLRKEIDRIHSELTSPDDVRPEREDADDLLFVSEATFAARTGPEPRDPLSREPDWTDNVDLALCELLGGEDALLED